MSAKNRPYIVFVSALVLLSLALSACERSIDRNADGSLTVQTTVSGQELNDAIQSSLADPLITGVTVSLQSGYALVTGSRQRLNDSSKTDTLGFRLDLSVSGGHLVASVSNAQVDGVAVESARGLTGTRPLPTGSKTSPAAVPIPPSNPSR